MNNDTSDDTNITFTGEYQFSIRCGKCADIHNAQLEGKNTEPCTCDCHAKIAEPYQPYVPYYPCPYPHYPDPYPQPYYYTGTHTGTIDVTSGARMI